MWLTNFWWLRRLVGWEARWKREGYSMGGERKKVEWDREDG